MFGHVPQFSHTRNPDGSFDSICKLCFVTIASSNLEEELAIAEAKHECNWREFFENTKSQTSGVRCEAIETASRKRRWPSRNRGVSLIRTRGGAQKWY